MSALGIPIPALSLALRPMPEAPTTGPVVDVLVATTDRAGCNGWLIAHYAEGGGEDQPPFKGWFFWTGVDFRQIEGGTLRGWIPLPALSAAPTPVAQPGVVNLTKLIEERSKMTPGDYEVWTSNSFRRITAAGGADGDVLRGEIQRHDGHPDLSGSNRDADLAGLVATHNAAPVLIEAVRAALHLRAAHLASIHARVAASGEGNASGNASGLANAALEERLAADSYDNALAKVSL